MNESRDVATGKLRWKEIKFKTLETRSLGRNGPIRTTGINVSSTGLGLELSPLTSKGEVARCDIQIPREDIPDFIELLKEML